MADQDKDRPGNSDPREIFKNIAETMSDPYTGRSATSSFTSKFKEPFQAGDYFPFTVGAASIALLAPVVGLLADGYNYSIPGTDHQTEYTLTLGETGYHAIDTGRTTYGLIREEDGTYQIFVDEGKNLSIITDPTEALSIARSVARELSLDDAAKDNHFESFGYLSNNYIDEDGMERLKSYDLDGPDGIIAPHASLITNAQAIWADASQQIESQGYGLSGEDAAYNFGNDRDIDYSKAAAGKRALDFTLYAAGGWLAFFSLLGAGNGALQLRRNVSTNIRHPRSNQRGRYGR